MLLRITGSALRYNADNFPEGEKKQKHIFLPITKQIANDFTHWSWEVISGMG